MALSDSQLEKGRKRPKQKALTTDVNLRWSDSQKLEAVKTFLVIGNLSLVGRLLSIPRVTLAKWKASAWWKEVADELRVQDNIELSNKMKSLVNAAHMVVANRLEHGDAVLNQKTGTIVYKPVAMKDAHRVAVDMLNQKNVLDKVVGVDTPPEANMDKLEQLAEKFAEFATKKIEQKIDKRRTIDVDMVEVVDEVVQDNAFPDNLLSDYNTRPVQEMVQEEQNSS